MQSKWTGWHLSMETEIHGDLWYVSGSIGIGSATDTEWPDSTERLGPTETVDCQQTGAHDLRWRSSL